MDAPTSPPSLDRQTLRDCRLRYRGRRACVRATCWSELPSGCAGIAWPLDDQEWAFQPLAPTGAALAYRLSGSDLGWDSER